MMAVTAVLLIARAARGLTERDDSPAAGACCDRTIFETTLCAVARSGRRPSTRSARLLSLQRRLCLDSAAKGKRVPQEFLDPEKASEKERVLLEWVFLDGVQLQKELETLKAYSEAGGDDVVSRLSPPDGGRGKFTAEMVFGPSSYTAGMSSMWNAGHRKHSWAVRTDTVA